jgi:hypothetical protein
MGRVHHAAMGRHIRRTVPPGHEDRGAIRMSVDTHNIERLPEEKGREMKRSMVGLILLTTVATTVIGSCTIMERVRQLSPGEIRLTRLQAPEVVEEGNAYQGTLYFRSDAIPTVKRVCCRWIAENPTVQNSSMYWYNLEVSGNMDPGTEGTKWLDQGPIQDFSNTFCMTGNDLRTIGADSIVFNFPAKGIKQIYNKLECYAETSHDGALRETNRVGAPVNRGRR